METVLILAANVLALAIIMLIIIYLVEDRRRFRVEVQFRAVRGKLDEWVSLAGELPGCADDAAAYHRTRNISRKYILAAALYDRSYQHRTESMRTLEYDLAAFADIYNALAEPYNRRLGGRSAAVMKMLGFRPLPKLSFEGEPYHL